jgi:hypothetical protein
VEVSSFMTVNHSSGSALLEETLLANLKTGLDQATQRFLRNQLQRDTPMLE